jgi:hypothetical protein
MASVINASVSSNGIVSTADASGILKVQSNGVTTNALAWVNFNGTLSTPITPRANYNVGSVTKNGTGDYTVNFTSALTDANYSAVVSGGSTSNGNALAYNFGAVPTTSAVRIRGRDIYASATADCDYVNVAIFGN